MKVTDLLTAASLEELAEKDEMTAYMLQRAETPVTNNKTFVGLGGRRVRKPSLVGYHTQAQRERIIIKLVRAALSHLSNRGITATVARSPISNSIYIYTGFGFIRFSDHKLPPTYRNDAMIDCINSGIGDSMTAYALRTAIDECLAEALRNGTAKSKVLA